MRFSLAIPRARTARLGLPAVRLLLRRVGQAEDRVGEDALGQRVAPLDALAARDRELPGRPQGVEHALRRRPLPVAAAGAAEVARGDLAALARERQHLVGELLVLLRGSARTSAGSGAVGALADAEVRLVAHRAAGRPRAPSTRTPAPSAGARRARRRARGRSAPRARAAASGRRRRSSRSARSRAARCRRRARPCARGGGAPRSAASRRRGAARLRARSRASVAQACASHSSTSARVSTPIGVVPSATSTAGLDCRSW